MSTMYITISTFQCTQTVKALLKKIGRINIIETVEASLNAIAKRKIPDVTKFATCPNTDCRFK